MTSVLNIDDHPIVLQGCRRMLEDAGIETVLEARDPKSGYRLYHRHRPDVVSVDLAMQVALVRTGVRQDPLAELTPRELQTLSLLAQGKPYGRIAEELNVSYKTVVNACSQLKQKLNAKSLPDLIRLAVQLVSAET